MFFLWFPDGAQIFVVIAPREVCLILSASFAHSLSCFCTQQHHPSMRIVALLLSSALVLVGIILFMLNRFHYSVDIILAVLLTLLCYTNVGVALVVDMWSEWTRMGHQEKHGDDGVLWIPPFFFPFCCLRGRYLVHASTTQEYLQHQEDVYATHVKRHSVIGDFASAQVRPDQADGDAVDGSGIGGATAAADENKVDLGASKYVVPEAGAVGKDAATTVVEGKSTAS